MASTTLNIAVVLSAIDRMSGVFNSATNKSISELDKLKKASTKKMLGGTAMIGTGVGLALSLKPAIDAYEELEVAQANLQSRVMRAGGITDPKVMASLTAEAGKLGDLLPGTTADLENMFTVMLENNIAAERITNGLGEATAFFAVNNKMAYADAALYVARLSDKLGIADKDALEFLDTINRTKQLGISADEMGYAFSRSAGALKLLRLEGVEAFNKVAPITAELVKVLGSGETAGTSFSKVMAAFNNTDKLGAANAAMKEFGIQMKFFDNKGVFLGIDNMLAQLGKLDKLNPKQQKGFIDAITGGEGQDVGALVTMMNLAAESAKRYQEISKQMADKASLEEQVKVQLDTLAALKEAAGGTFTNMLAAFGKSIAPELKLITKLLGNVSAWIKKFAENNPKIFKTIGIFIALASVILIVAGAITAVTGAIALMTLMSLTFPGVWIFMALAAVAAIIIANWEPISAFFENTFGGMIEWCDKAIDKFNEMKEPVKAWVDPIISLMKVMANPSFVIPELMKYFGNESSAPAAGNSTANKMNPVSGGNHSMVYAPAITIQGNASKYELREALGFSQSQFESHAKEMQRDRERKGYGPKGF